MAKRNAKSNIDRQYLESLAKEDPTAKTRGSLIRQAIREKKFDVREIEKRTGLSFQMFNAFMVGKVNISYEKANKIAEMLELNVADIITPNNSTVNDAIRQSSESASKIQKAILEDAKILAKDFEDEPENKTPEHEKNIESVQEDSIKKEEEKERELFLPGEEELVALVVLCSEKGRKLAYEKLWEILADPECRKGGAA